jgi:hypothetical protein
MTMAPELCLVCGGCTFEHTPILWSSLIREWELDEDEARYIDIQQGTHCIACGANVRSSALAAAIMGWKGFRGTLASFVEDPRYRELRILEINEAANLHQVLVTYPAFDMTRAALPSRSADLIVHSDTLEHVVDPLQGLRECRRLVADEGAVIFTVPTVIGRLSRSRSGLPPSYHGQADSIDPGMKVHTEFGADVWTYVIRAGFASCELFAFRFPAGLAIVARP